MRVWITVLAVCCGVCVGMLSAHAAQKPVSVISVEAETGLLLYEENADIERPPASMIKIMCMLLVAEGIERGDWALDTPITATRKAQRMGGTQVYLAEGETLPLGKLMDAVAVASANDCAMAVAEGLWGSEEAYLGAVAARAAELGMNNTEFNSVHGLPPDRGENPDRTTARDMARLARACVAFPQILAWCSQQRIVFRPNTMPFPSTNKLLKRMDNCDGLKTGFIRAAGFCIAATAHKDDFRVVTVVMGHQNPEQRFRLAQKQMHEGLNALQRRVVAQAGAEPSAPVLKVGNCETATVQLQLADELSIITTEEYWPRVELVFDHPQQLQAPIVANTKVGEAVVRVDDRVLARTDLVVVEAMPAASWTWRAKMRLQDFVDGKSDKP